MTDAPAPALLLAIDSLAVDYRSGRTTVPAVRDVSLRIHRGEKVAVVGESGSGKSTTAQAVIQLLASNATITGGSVAFDGIDLVHATAKELRGIRGRRIGLVPQDPTVSLNPVTRIGAQVAEVLVVHRLASKADAARRAVEALREAGLANPEVQAQQYPHELSGGMRQRVLIALALIARPDLLIADEPTSALDVTVQRQILDHLDRLVAETGTSVLFITHDLGVAADRADRIVVLSDGRVVEEGTPDEVLRSPKHPYTKKLIAAAPSLQSAPALRALQIEARASANEEPETGDARADDVLVATSLVKEFPIPRTLGHGVTRAVDDVSFGIPRGGTLALVGESGSGKSTTARLALRLADVTSGTVTVDGDDVTSIRGSRLRAFRRRAQIVQQNPYAALNPRLSIGSIVSDPLAAFGEGSRATRKARAVELIDLVELPASVLKRRAAELSGGQRQRVAIARALALRPELLVLDEPVSALDVSVQAQILDLLAGLQAELGVSYLFISHDLAVVRQIADRVGVLRRGRLVELAPTAQVFDAPSSEYTKALLEAIPGQAVRV
ncbi:ABC transporter ATP-binding protein [Frondihabitans cladoniiphilus]|uniref:ABC transporter ATP-binding protein n=1 Tax=Frondihabitans cladoniiphilus TaxID=715785 RepID=A0ABP8VTF4_9MICO